MGVLVPAVPRGAARLPAARRAGRRPAPGGRRRSPGQPRAARSPSARTSASGSRSLFDHGRRAAAGAGAQRLAADPLRRRRRPDPARRRRPARSTTPTLGRAGPRSTSAWRCRRDPAACPRWFEPLLTRLRRRPRRGLHPLRHARPSGGRASAVLVLLGEEPGDRPGRAGPAARRDPAQPRRPAGLPRRRGRPGGRRRRGHRAARGERGGRPRPGQRRPCWPSCRSCGSRSATSWSRRCWPGGTRRTRCSPRDPAEVAHVARLPVAELVDPANRLRVRHPSGWIGPAFQVARHAGLGLHRRGARPRCWSWAAGPGRGRRDRVVELPPTGDAGAVAGADESTRRPALTDGHLRSDGHPWRAARTLDACPSSISSCCCSCSCSRSAATGRASSSARCRSSASSAARWSACSSGRCSPSSSPTPRCGCVVSLVAVFGLAVLGQALAGWARRASCAGRSPAGAGRRVDDVGGALVSLVARAAGGLAGRRAAGLVLAAVAGHARSATARCSRGRPGHARPGPGALRRRCATPSTPTASRTSSATSRRPGPGRSPAPDPALAGSQVVVERPAVGGQGARHRAELPPPHRGLRLRLRRRARDDQRARGGRHPDGRASSSTASGTTARWSSTTRSATWPCSTCPGCTRPSMRVRRPAGRTGADAIVLGFPLDGPYNAAVGPGPRRRARSPARTSTTTGDGDPGGLHDPGAGPQRQLGRPAGRRRTARCSA